LKRDDDIEIDSNDMNPSKQESTMILKFRGMIIEKK
jgi:hypothetical protein